MLGGVVLINIWCDEFYCFLDMKSFFSKKKSFFCVMKWHTASIDVNVMHTHIICKDKFFILRNRTRYHTPKFWNLKLKWNFFLLFSTQRRQFTFFLDKMLQSRITWFACINFFGSYSFPEPMILELPSVQSTQ